MNNIKFRVFNKRANAYENPKDYVLTADGRLMMIFEHEVGRENFIELRDVSDCVGNIYVIEQYLGVYDESTNELAINDIVLGNPYKNYSYNGKYITAYDNVKCQFCLKYVEDGHDFNDLSIGDGLPYRIIGNIHDVKE